VPAKIEYIVIVGDIEDDAGFPMALWRTNAWSACTRLRCDIIPRKSKLVGKLDFVVWYKAKVSHLVKGLWRNPLLGTVQYWWDAVNNPHNIADVLAIWGTRRFFGTKASALGFDSKL
jgi:hypothetical protein